MTEQEKRRRRREMERRMRTGGRIRESEKGGLFTFRLYVTGVLVGGCFLISLFDTATANRFCERLQEAVAEQISMETLAEWQEKAAAFLQKREIALPAFEEKEAQEEQRIYLPDTEDSP